MLPRRAFPPTPTSDVWPRIMVKEEAPRGPQGSSGKHWSLCSLSRLDPLEFSWAHGYTAGDYISQPPWKLHIVLSFKPMGCEHQVMSETSRLHFYGNIACPPLHLSLSQEHGCDGVCQFWTRRLGHHSRDGRASREKESELPCQAE